MDLLQQELNKNKQINKSKKIVLALIVICVALLILAVLGMVLLPNVSTKKELTINIDEKSVVIDQKTVINVDGKNYISLEQISKPIGYNYVQGGYLEYTEDDKKCYLENKNQIIGFEADSNKIFKTTVNSKTDYKYFQLNNNILYNNQTLYIALEDLGVGCDLGYNYSEKENTIEIRTLSNVIKLYEKKLKEKSLKISTDVFDNNKSVLYGMLIVSNENGKMGVVNSNLETIIGMKYAKIFFDEYSQNFIVTDDNKYGVVSKEAQRIIDLKFQNIEIINYDPLLYKVKLNDKYGVLRSNEITIVNTEYDNIGTSDGLLIIKNINNTDQDGIIVGKDGKYGIINIQSGSMIVNCELNKIYSKNENNSVKYYIKNGDIETTLEEYIDMINTTVVQLSN